MKKAFVREKEREREIDMVIERQWFLSRGSVT